MTPDKARHGRLHRDQTRWGRSFAVGGVTTLAGLLFAINAHLLAGSNQTDGGLLGLVRAQDREVADLAASVAALASDVDSLTEQSFTDDAAGTVGQVSLGLDVVAGRSAVTGPGVSLTMNDAPQSDGLSGSWDAYVVHQQDVEAVLNTLWSAGAEAVTVQGVRLTAVTAVQCVGNVLLVGGRIFSPPYSIEAIGPAQALVTALAETPSLASWRQAVDELGLGWSVKTSQNLSLPPAAGGNIALRYVSVAAIDRDRGKQS